VPIHLYKKWNELKNLKISQGPFKGKLGGIFHQLLGCLFGIAPQGREGERYNKNGASQDGGNDSQRSDNHKTEQALQSKKIPWIVLQFYAYSPP